MRACTASSTLSGSSTPLELVEVDAPALVLEVVGRPRARRRRGRCARSARAAPGCPPRAPRPRRSAPRRSGRRRTAQQVLHHRRGLDVAERRQLDRPRAARRRGAASRRVARAARAGAMHTTRMGPRRFSTRYASSSSESSCAHCRSSNTRTSGSAALAGVGLEEALDDGTPHRAQLLRRRPRPREMSGESWNSRSSSWPRKYATSPTLRSSSTVGQLGADLRLRRLGVHPFDDPEPARSTRAKTSYAGPPRAPCRGRRAARCPPSRERTRSRGPAASCRARFAPRTVTVRVCFLSRARA